MQVLIVSCSITMTVDMGKELEIIKRILTMKPQDEHLQAPRWLGAPTLVEARIGDWWHLAPERLRRMHYTHEGLDKPGNHLVLPTLPLSSSLLTVS